MCPYELVRNLKGDDVAGHQRLLERKAVEDGRQCLIGDEQGTLEGPAVVAGCLI